MKRLVLIVVLVIQGCAGSVISEEEYKDCEAVCFTWQNLAIECGVDYLVACDLDACVEHILAEHHPVWCRHVEMFPASCQEVTAHSATPLFPLQCSAE